MPNANDKYRLGRDCTVTVDGQLLQSVTEVGIRRLVRETDVTGFMHAAESSLVTHRTYEIDIELLKPAEANRLRDAEARGRVVTVTAANGTREFTADFTVADSSADEPLNDAVRPRFTLRQWAHPKQ